MPLGEVVVVDDDQISLTSSVESEQQSEYEIEEILAQRETHEGVLTFLVKWAGYAIHRASWEPADQFNNPETLEDWNEKLRRINDKKAPAFDVQAWERHVLRIEADRKDRKRRRAAKRNRLRQLASDRLKSSSEPNTLPDVSCAGPTNKALTTRDPSRPPDRNANPQAAAPKKTTGAAPECSWPPNEPSNLSVSRSEIPLGSASRGAIPSRPGQESRFSISHPPINFALKKRPATADLTPSTPAKRFNLSTQWRYEKYKRHEPAPDISQLELHVPSNFPVKPGELKILGASNARAQQEEHYLEDNELFVAQDGSTTSGSTDMSIASPQLFSTPTNQAPNGTHDIPLEQRISTPTSPQPVTTAPRTAPPDLQSPHLPSKKYRFALGEILVFAYYGPEKTEIGPVRICGANRRTKINLLRHKKTRDENVEVWFRDVCTPEEYDDKHGKVVSPFPCDRGWLEGYEESKQNLRQMANVLRTKNSMAIYRPNSSADNVLIAYWPHSATSRFENGRRSPPAEDSICISVKCLRNGARWPRRPSPQPGETDRPSHLSSPARTPTGPSYRRRTSSIIEEPGKARPLPLGPSSPHLSQQVAAQLSNSDTKPSGLLQNQPQRLRSPEPGGNDRTDENSKTRFRPESRHLEAGRHIGFHEQPVAHPKPKISLQIETCLQPEVRRSSETGFQSQELKPQESVSRFSRQPLDTDRRPEPQTTNSTIQSDINLTDNSIEFSKAAPSLRQTAPWPGKKQLELNSPSGQQLTKELQEHGYGKADTKLQSSMSRLEISGGTSSVPVDVPRSAGQFDWTSVLGQPNIDAIIESKCSFTFKELATIGAPEKAVLANVFYVLYPIEDEKVDAEYKALVQFLKSHKAVVFSSRIDEDWEKFALTVPIYQGVVLFHGDFTNYHELPYLKDVLSKQANFWRISLSKTLEYVPQPVHLQRVFPRGSVILITEDLMVNDQCGTMIILMWFIRNIKSGKLPGTWKLFLRPNVMKWLLEKHDTSKEERESVYWLAIYYLIDTINGTGNEPDDVIDDPFTNTLISPTFIPQYNSYQDTDRLVEFFAGWALLNNHRFRRFHVATYQKPLPRRWGEWNHLDIRPSPREVFRHLDINHKEVWEKVKPIIRKVESSSDPRIQTPQQNTYTPRTPRTVSLPQQLDGASESSSSRKSLPVKTTKYNYPDPYH
ncbi:hypothetical protein ASPZODRAFT_136444 [Penicilliopsis zonata CBS 506.65]|uniref:Chromo domain-containing protein n=1 Tax=Penicilliopsis zonata CBS 506.65 TaxID=1073090 RepID=A0A1L9S7V9_9EURO|nr:hypothetical protein ASPZODRAFT_136444 [Penicilliopsis zonata CBS 506.65]OJJ43234.1 hypothetical protein ASPZODRAFT_136444 [Penicilliopsis zonata CBS 506.65]